MTERTFTAKRVIKRSPWDVYAFFADPEQQAQWRDAHAKHGTLVGAEPYTMIGYNDVLIDIEPEGEETLVTMTKTHRSQGTLGRLAQRLINTRTHEAELMKDLVRADNALTFDAI